MRAVRTAIAPRMRRLERIRQMKLPEIFLLCAAVAVSPLRAEHNGLLPRPQQIQYGAGELPLDRLQIRLAPAASDEDRFVAREIAAVLGTILRHPVTIDESG